jgi:hypothetical protein
MTDMPPPNVPEPPAPVAPPEMVAPPPPPPPAPAKQPSKLRTYLSIGVLVVILGGVLYAVRNNQSAGDLAVGTCFDVPTASDFSTVEKHECTEAHDAEVVLVAEYTESNTFPISLTLDRYIDDTCLPAAERYVGRAAETIDDLQLGLFSPTLDAWTDGKRTFTCYVMGLEGVKLTKSVKAAS